MVKVYAVGVGPGSPTYLTSAAIGLLKECDVVIGYRHALKTIQGLAVGKEIREVTMRNQEEVYQDLLANYGEKKILVLFTGDVSFSESEVVDRLFEIFGYVELVPGISSVQVAAARTAMPLDKALVITMHVTSSIEKKKRELFEAVAGGRSVILIPRPWSSRPDKRFMPSELAYYLERMNLDIKNLKAKVFERLTLEDESVFEGSIEDLKGVSFSDMSVVVLPQATPDSYMNYKWQWAD